MQNQSKTFFFYDLETSGIDPRRQRIMQFAGIRTDLELNPIGEPINAMVALSDDVLPEPMAVMITGITPQKVSEEGYSEADLLRLLQEQVFTPGTIVTGFNSVRFDDEFLRYTLYRNFYDPYEWCWSDGRSRWDLLDIVRLVRALRPDGIKWPVDDKGNPTNRLELLTSSNGLDHANAHDALSDVQALIAVAKLIRSKQPKLFDYMLGLRDKKEVAKVVNLENPQPFVYVSGRYPSEFEKATVAFPIAPGNRPGSVLVYDLRHDPAEFAKLSTAQLAERLFADWETRKSDGFVQIPVKELAYNKCPAVAPLGTLDAAAQKRIQLTVETVQKNLQKLLASSDFGEKIRAAFDTRAEYPKSGDVDAQLYDGFMNNKDKAAMGAVRAADRNKLVDFNPNFSDDRLVKLLLRYKARNYPQSLSADERVAWEEYRGKRIQADLPSYLEQLKKLSGKYPEDEAKQFLLSELGLWAESIVPTID